MPGEIHCRSIGHRPVPALAAMRPGTPGVWGWSYNNTAATAASVRQAAFGPPSEDFRTAGVMPRRPASRDWAFLP